jgi:hypothetical protein
MAVQTEVEYISTGVEPILPQYASIAVGSPVLKYSHTNVGTTPEPEPMSLVSSPPGPTTFQQNAALEPPPLPLPVPPKTAAAVAESSATEVILPCVFVLAFSNRDFSVSATEPLADGNELYTIYPGTTTSQPVPITRVTSFTQFTT